MFTFGLSGSFLFDERAKVVVMCKLDLKALLLAANAGDDKDALAAIIEKFQPLIKKYSNRLNYDEAASDVIISLHEVIYKLNPIINIDPYCEGELVNLLNTSLRRKVVDLHRKHKLETRIKETPFDDLEHLSASYGFEDAVMIHETLSMLTEKQRFVLEARYYHGYSGIEIAAQMKISRQAVNKLQQRAVECFHIAFYEDE